MQKVLQSSITYVVLFKLVRSSLIYSNQLLEKPFVLSRYLGSVNLLRSFIDMVSVDDLKRVDEDGYRFHYNTLVSSFFIPTISIVAHTSPQQRAI